MHLQIFDLPKNKSMIGFCSLLRYSGKALDAFRIIPKSRRNLLTTATATNSDNCQSSQKEMVGELNCHRNLLGTVSTMYEDTDNR